MSHKGYIRVGNLCGDKVQYPDGTCCCVWQPFPDDEGSGCCWDFALSDIDDLIQLLQQLKAREPEIYIETPNEETEKTLAESEAGIDLHKYLSVDELMKDLESEPEITKTEANILIDHVLDILVGVGGEVTDEMLQKTVDILFEIKDKCLNKIRAHRLSGHSGDCTIYASLSNVEMPEAGVCVCGYGLQCLRNGDSTHMYSKEFLQRRTLEKLR